MQVLLSFPMGGLRRWRPGGNRGPLAISKVTPKMLEETLARSLEQVTNKVNGVYLVNFWGMSSTAWAAADGQSLFL